MSATVWAALLKGILGPIMIFCGLLLARWGAIVVYRLLPDGNLRRLLSDRTLLDRRPGILLAAVAAVLGGFVAYFLSVGNP